MTKLALKQDQRNLRIATPLGDDAFVVARLEAVEEISRPFRVDAELLSPEPDLKFDDIVGKSVTVGLKTAAGERYWNGIVHRFRQSGTTLDLTRYEAEIVPWFWLLTQTADCRIFQNMTVPAILKKVFDEHGFGDYSTHLSGSYPEREYCVQYRETAFDFASRLMEEEGIHYFFEHENGRHVLALADAPSANRDCPGQAKARYNPERRAVLPEGTVHGLACQQEVSTTKVTLRDFNFERPLEPLWVDGEGKAPYGSLERYDFPGGYADNGEGKRYARLRAEAYVSPRSVLAGNSFCRSFLPGYVFELTEHPRRDLNQKLLLIRVVHRARAAGGVQAGRSAGGEFSYWNEFRASPHKVPFRPQRITPVPRVHGAQTAVVVGPKGEEIHTDKYGRVKVQFHWDREGKFDEKSSCWVRAAQVWAGKNWGAQFLPRVGQEVVVEFLEGDPDRPLITGRVYNGEAMPAFKLPDEKTKSGIKTRSSKDAGTDNLNVIRFEDRKGEEQLFIQAEKDFHERTKNDTLEWIGQDRHLIIKRHRKESIEENAHLTVKGDRMRKVEGTEHLTVDGDRLVKVKGEAGLDVAKDRSAKVGGDDNLDVAGDRNGKAGGTVSWDAGKDLMVKAGMNTGLESGMNAHIKGGMNVVVEAGIQLTLKAGPGFITIGPSGVAISGPMVMINSGGAAGSGSGASPISPAPPGAPDLPEEPLEADKAAPTDKDEAPEPPPERKQEKWSLQAMALKAAADSGAGFCEMGG